MIIIVVEYPAHSEVTDFKHECVHVDENIGRGQISMDDIRAVYVLKKRSNHDKNYEILYEKNKTNTAKHFRNYSDVKELDERAIAVQRYLHKYTLATVHMLKRKCHRKIK